MSSSSVLLFFFLPLFLLFLSIKLVLSKKSIGLPPSPPKLPFIGNLHQLGSLPHRSLHELAKKHGPLMLLHLGQVPTLVISSSEMAREILQTHDIIFANRPFLKAAKIVLHLNMSFTPYGESWRQHRRIYMTHLLGVKRVHSYRAAREDEVAHLMEKISSSSKKALNMSQALSYFASDMLCRVILGKVQREEERNKMIRQMIDELSSMLSGFRIEDYFPSLGWLSSSSGFDERAKRHAEKWNDMLDKMIDDHVNRKEEKNEEDYDFVDVLLALQKGPNMEVSLTRELIRALLLDMFTAGGTPYIVLEWSMAELIKNPQAMKKLQDEVRSIAHGKSMVEENDLSAMSYLQVVLKEVMRLHLPAPFLLPRESSESCKIGGYEVPKQTRVMVNAWAIARDPEIWEAPEEFRPERFLGSSTDFKGQDFQYTPFGAGRRICPGMHLAVSIVELALANLVHQFYWGLPEGMAAEDLDMTEAAGLSTRMKTNLYLVPNPCF